MDSISLVHTFKQNKDLFLNFSSVQARWRIIRVLHTWVLFFCDFIRICPVLFV
jgi:hypothetical protein